MKRWSEKAKERVLVTQGQWKSSVKNPRRHAPAGALLGYGVQLDGFSNSKMTSKSNALVRLEEEHVQRNAGTGRLKHNDQGTSPESYFKSLEASNSNRLPRLSRFRRTVSRASMLDKLKMAVAETGEVTSDNEGNVKTPSPDHKRTATLNVQDPSVKLPPIREKFAKVSKQRLKHNKIGAKSDVSIEAKENGMQLKTGNKGMTAFSHSSMYSPEGKQSHCSSSLPESSTMSKSTIEKADNRQPPTNAIIAVKNDRNTKAKLTKNIPKKGDILLLPTAVDPNSKPFSHEKLYLTTLSVYERYRGIKSHDYAVQCLLVANSFKEKPWLTQVHQAMNIAALGVRRSLSQQPHLFSGKPEDTSPPLLKPPGSTNQTVAQ